METLPELVKIIKSNINKEIVKIVETPKRCTLKHIYDLVNVTGYFVEFWYPEYGYGEYLFISDVENKTMFHRAPSLFLTEYFKFRCRWVSRDEVDFIGNYEFYI